MKKFSKIFLVLLTLSLIFGSVFTVAASAATETTNMLNVSGASHNRNTDFESSSNIVPAFAWASGQKGNVYVTSKVDSNDNTYTNYSAKVKGSKSTSTIEGWVPVSDYSYANQRNGTANFGAHDFVTIDFEIGTDQYSYKDDGGVWHTVDKFEDIPEEFRPKDPHTALALYDKMSININGRGAGVLSSAGTAASSETNFAFIYTVQDSSTGKWYLSADNAYSEGDIELSNEIGIYDHITYVFEVKREADSSRTTDYNFKNTKVHAFINGEYLCSSAVSTNQDSTAPNAIRFFVPEADRTSFCIDNVAINWYGHRNMTTSTKNGITYYKYSTVDTVYSSDGYGIDDYITSGDYLTKPLYMCEDVVYDINYSFVGSPAAATLEHLDGTTDTYSNPYAASKNLQAGDFVHMYANFVDFTPASYDIDEVTFISYDDSKLSLSDEAAQFYKLQHTGDRYTIRLADSGIHIKWLAGNTIDSEVIKEHYLVPFVAPHNNDDSLKIYGAIKYTENKATIEILQGWKWDKDGDGQGDEALDNIFKAYTVEGINKLMEEGIKEIVVVPEFKETDICYALLPVDSAIDSANPDFIIDNYNFASLTDFSTLSSALSKVSADEPVKVVLYSDYEISSNSVISIPKATTVNFDLNGHDINSSADNVFAISEGSVLNLYSTAAGSVITAKGVITSEGIDAAEVNIGEMLNADEEVIAAASNIEIAAEKLLNLVGSSTDAANANKIFINLNGGAYFETADKALFSISEMDMVINVSGGAVIYSDKSSALFSIDEKYNASAEINVADSTIIAKSVIGNWGNSSKMLIADSTVVGIDLTKSNVTLAQYALVSAYDCNVKTLSTSKNATLVLASESVLSLPVSITGYESVVDYSENVYFNVLTIDLSDDVRPAPFDSIEILPVTWLTPDGDVHEVTYWVDGSEVDISLVSATEFGVDKTVANNGWFTFSYNTWENATAGEGFVVSKDKENNFKPKAENIVEALDVVHVSFDISDVIKYNVYLPTPGVAGADIVFDYTADSRTGFFDVNGNAITNGIFNNETVNGTNGWTKLAVDIAHDDFSAHEITLKYTVNGVLLETTIVIDMFDYANKVDAAFGCGTTESQLVYAMIEFRYTLYKQLEDSSIDDDIIFALESQLAIHGASCKCGEVEYTAPTSESVDYAAIENDVLKFAYLLELDEENKASYAFSIYFNKDSSVSTVASAGKNFAKYETANYVEFRLTGISLADINDVISITVDGTAVSYSLATYIEETNSSFAKALYVISEASEIND